MKAKLIVTAGFILVGQLISFLIWFFVDKTIYLPVFLGSIIAALVVFRWGSR